MSKWSEGAELLQKIITAKEVIPVQSDLIALQQTLFSLQSDQMKLLDENNNLKDEIRRLGKLKAYKYETGRTWMINPEYPDIKLCPVCLNKEQFESPLGDEDEMSHRYCTHCRGSYK